MLKKLHTPTAADHLPKKENKKKLLFDYI